MNFKKNTSDYEAWLGRHLTILEDDLQLKHTGMREDVFPFLRATFYRWAQLFPQVCPECAEAPRVLAVGDLHVENFGTWRDAEGRLVWGINDFDEAARMPWTIDLVRLAASAHLAIDSDQLHIDHRDACAGILAGYREGLETGGMPWVLAGKHAWLRDMVNPGLRDPAVFWSKLTALPDHKERLPGTARRALERMMPAPKASWRISHRIAGMGSLGRERYVAIAEFAGSFVCREAKALAPSAWDWATGGGEERIRYQKAVESAVRAPDPWVHLEDNWIVRRLAPDCARIDLAMFPREKDETKLLRAMGWETANLHLGSSRTRDVLRDLHARPANWLHKAAARMVAATKADWNEWRGPSPRKRRAVKKASVKIAR